MSIWKITKSPKRPGWSVVIGPYDDDFIKAIKESAGDGNWDWLPGPQAWVIRSTRTGHVQRVIDTFTPGATPTPDPPNLAEITGFLRDLGKEVSTEDLAELGEYFHAGACDVHGDATTETMVAVRSGKRLVVLAVFEVST